MSSRNTLAEQKLQQLGISGEELRRLLSAISRSNCDINHIVEHYTGCDFQCALGLQYQFSQERDPVRAFSLYSTAAKQGHLLALSIIRHCYREGLDVEKDFRKSEMYHTLFNRRLTADQDSVGRWECRLSFTFLKQLAFQQDHSVQFLLGTCYDQGLGTTVDREVAHQWIQQSAHRGNTNALNYLGVLSYKRNDFNEAIRLFNLAANRGNAAAQNHLGSMFFHGLGVQRNLGEAFRYYRLAADQGYADAQNSVGYCLKNGHGVKRNFTDAVKWYRLSAEGGCVAAINNLGVCYQYGQGVQPSKAIAIQLFQSAASQGHTDAYNNLNNMIAKEQGQG